MDRTALDAFARRHRLSPAAVETALRLTGLRPDARAWRAFGARLAHAVGLGTLGAGALFFVAANWQGLGLFGRFGLLEAALLGCVAVALWRPPPSLPGRSALVVATLLVGGLLALFGLGYQTGADTYELFFTWAALALPFAVAGMAGAVWAVWWTVLNVALALLCGWTGPEHAVWRLIDGPGVSRTTTLMLPCVLNLLGAGALLRLRRTALAEAAPLWLVRGLATVGFAFGTAASIIAVSGAFRSAAQGDLHGTVSVLLFAALCGGIAVAARHARRDVFPLALIAASWIAISTVWFGRALRFDDVVSFFLIAAWLIAASMASGALLMHWVRDWRDLPGNADGATA